MTVLIRASSAQTKHCPRDRSLVTSRPKEFGDGFQTRAQWVLEVCCSLSDSRWAGRPPSPELQTGSNVACLRRSHRGFQLSTHMNREKRQREGLSTLFEPLPFGVPTGLEAAAPG